MCDECIDRSTPEQKLAKKEYQKWLSDNFAAGVEWRRQYSNATYRAERMRVTNPEFFSDYNGIDHALDDPICPTSEAIRKALEGN